MSPVWPGKENQKYVCVTYRMRWESDDNKKQQIKRKLYAFIIFLYSFFLFSILLFLTSFKRDCHVLPIDFYSSFCSFSIHVTAHTQTSFPSKLPVTYCVYGRNYPNDKETGRKKKEFPPSVSDTGNTKLSVY